MTKCLLKALKAVDLDKHVGLFRSLGYESAGALAHFRTEHFEKLTFNEQELLRLIALLDVLKESTRDGKICPHYFNTNKTHTQQSNIKSTPIRASWSDETIQQRNSQSNLRKPSKRSTSSTGITGRLSSTSMAPMKLSSNEFTPQRSSTGLSRQHPTTPMKTNNQRILGPKSFFHRPAVQHVKVKSYNYGIPTNRRSRNTPHRTSFHHGSSSMSSPRHPTDSSSYGKPAEIYVYARKRPLLPAETTFQDTIAVPDNKRIIITENKANLDSTPLLKKTEFQFDHVFGSDASNKEIFQSTVFPFISSNQRHNLTYICFGQTGSGKSHTIFGGKTTDGLLVYCTQLLLQETLTGEHDLIGSFYEIYNNQVYDLINAGKRLFVREDGEHHVNVIGAREFILGTLDHLRAVIDDGLARRHHGKSAFNSNSSRSHAVFQMILKNNYDASESFRLIFIDLAGSERATDAQNNQRQTRREGAQINWSLLALKECIRSMDLTHSHAPFRQSKLTHILRDSLVGTKTRTCLMATVSPPDDCCQCSLNTLQYASRIRDISMRHRHRIMPTANTVQTNFFNDLMKEQEKSQRNFKPATASTPVQRWIPTVDQRIYTASNSTDLNTRRIKPSDIDWQIAGDDDVPISGNGQTFPSSTREFRINSNIPTNNPQVHRFSSTTKTTEFEQSPSSYFPAPQTDIKKPSFKQSKRSLDSSHLLFDDGNERQWKVVPAPTINRHSESLQTTRMIPIHMSDDNPYSSTTGTESLGTKITKAATNGSADQRQQNSYIMNSLNLQKQYDAGTTTATTSDTEPMISSTQQEIKGDEAGFLTKREELLSIVSSRLTPTGKRSKSTTTPRNSRINSSVSSKTKNSHVSPARTRSKTRSIKSASSTTSLASLPSEKKSSFETKKSKISSSLPLPKFNPSIRRSANRHSQRTVPLRVHHSSDSDEHDKSRHSTHRRKRNASKNISSPTRSEARQIKNNEQSSLITPTPSPLPVQEPMKQTLDQSFQQGPISPFSSANIINPWPITTSYGSPSKDFGLRVSDQLNSLRTLLENRLTEQDDTKRPKKQPSTLQTSPGTFARHFLQSFRQSSYPNEFPSGDDDDDKEVERTFPSNHQNEKPKFHEADLFSSSTMSNNQQGPYETRIQPSLSSLSDELNQARVSSTATPTSSSTIASNLAAKIDAQEPRILSTHQTTDNHGSDTERTLSELSSANNSPLPVLHTFDLASGPSNAHDRLFDNGKESSLFPESSFDALLNSLKSMREKDLNFLVRNSDEKLIPVAD